MGEAFLWGLGAGSSLLVGAVIAFAWAPGPRLIGLLYGFGAGALISAVAYELVGDAFEAAGGEAVWIGLAAGALAFYLGDRLIDARGGHDRKSPSKDPDEQEAKAMVLGNVLDGIPEGIVLGMSLIGGGGGSVATIGAVLVSNLPEGIGVTHSLRKQRTRAQTALVWAGIALATGIASVLGYAFFDTASEDAVAFMQSFAGGAVLVMLVDTMIPHANRDGGPAAGLMTVLGFAVAFALASLA